MLHVFRRYQKFIFIVVTLVVIMTFVFFGTYQAFLPTHQETESEDVTAYVTPQGRMVGSRELAMLARLLSREGVGSDLIPANLCSRQWVSRYFLTPDLAAQWIDSKAPDLAEKWQREKMYQPYQHPERADLSVGTFWSFLAPELPQKLKELQTASSVEETIAARVALYHLQERAPPRFVSQLLRYRVQEAGFEMDPRLARGDIALFGYTDLMDWFGEASFLRLARIVIRGAEEAKVYPFSYEEAKEELLSRMGMLAEQLQNQKGIAVNRETLFQAFLRQEDYTETTFVNLYRDVRRFEESIEDLSDSIALEALPFEQIYGEAQQWVTVEVTRMPPSLRFRDLEEAAAFEAYVAALTSSQSGQIPQEPNPTDWVLGTWYQGYVGQMCTDDLLHRVTLRQLWDWEESHTDEWVAQFPQLKGRTLDVCSPEERADVDQMARRAIVQEHPEWMEEALKEVDMEPFSLFANGKEHPSGYPGITSILSLQQQFDAQDETWGYTQDQNHFFRWIVSHREPNHILTFEEARQQQLLPLLTQAFQGESLLNQFCARTGISPQQAVALRFEELLDHPDAVVWAPLSPKTEQKTVHRTQPEWLPFDDLMVQDEGTGVDPSEGSFRYHVVERGVDRSIPIQKLQQAKEWVAEEVRRPYLESLIQGEVA